MFYSDLVPKDFSTKEKYRMTSTPSQNRECFHLRNSTAITNSDFRCSFKKRIDMMFLKDGGQVQCSYSDIGNDDITLGFRQEPTKQSGSQFQVDYIGSVPVITKSTSLKSLQKPLKNLYLSYRKNNYPNTKLRALLEITEDGLKIQSFQDSEIKERLTPFSYIAVWAAMKFVYRPQESNKPHAMKYAFLPIVTDPGKTENSNLFSPLNQEDLNYAIEKTYDDHSPLFVVTMRQKHGDSGLQCHCFVCPTSEDAIMLAANLYKALMNLDKNKIANNSNECPPTRPPRKNRRTSNDDLDSIKVDREENVSFKINNETDTGDIFTKVIIPRTHSFLNSSRLCNKIGNMNKRKQSPQSPLGLIELFNELCIHEGLSSIDEILNTIINVDGMSFNGLKPIYKEFIFKLAVTLTKDELYQRSKYIMQKQRQRKARRSDTIGRRFRKVVTKIKPKVRIPTTYLISTLKKFQQRRKLLLKNTLKKHKKRYNRGFTYYSTDVVHDKRSVNKSTSTCNCTEDIDCNSSCNQKCYCSIKKLQSLRKDMIKSSTSTCSCDTESCVESEKCYCMKNKRQSIFEQLKEQGFAASESSLSRPNSPAGMEKCLENSSKHKKKYLQASKSLEFFQVGSTPNTETYYSATDIYPIEESLYRKSKSKDRNEKEEETNTESTESCGFTSNIDKSERNKILVVSARDRNGQVKNSITPFFRLNDKNILRHDNSDALSIKKAAEIAALFSNVKKSHCINSRNEIVYSVLNSSKRLLNRRNGFCLRSSNLERSLGYFP